MKTKEEVLSILKTKPNGNIEEYNFKKKFPEHYAEILKISFPEDFKFPQKLYHYLHDDPELKLGLCPVCGKRCAFHRFGRGYKKHCSQKCKSLDIEVQNKTKKTCLEKYGKEVYTQTDEFKIRNKEICLTLYGTEHPQRLQEIKDKARETCIKRYGAETFSKLPEWKEKVISTNKELFGKDFYMQTDEYKERCKNTCLERYGKEHYTQTDSFKEQYKRTCEEKYGVVNYSYTEDFRKNRNKKISYDDLTFDSSWEVDVYKYCIDNNIECEYQPLITFKYEYGGKIHHYHPDFLIDGKLYEVKGNQFFDEDKMINPFDRSQDELFEAKHQCMVNNDVIILKEYEVKHISDIIKKDVQ